MTRVLVYSPLKLVCESITSLLAGSEDVEVVGCETLPEVALQRMKDTRPDVVILGSEGSESAPSPLVARLWREGCQAKVIELGLSGRVMFVYHVDQVLVTDAADLLRAID